MSVEQFISQNYNELLSIAKKVCKKKATNIVEDSHDLLSSTLEYALNNKMKFENKNPGEIRFMLVRAMTNQFKWDKGEFRECVKRSGSIPDTSVHVFSSDNYEIFETIEIGNDVDRDFFIDRQNKFTTEQTLKILSVIKSHKSLDKLEKQLFKYYFVDQLTMREISEKTGIPLAGNKNTIHGMINELIDKIKILCKKYLTN